MKKRLLKNAISRERIWLRKLFLRMNYLFCLLVLGALSVSAEVYSQNGLVSLKMKDASLVKVFNEITKQTGYDFLYNYDLVQNKGTVDVNAKMVALKDFLHDLLKGKNLGFEFRDEVIIVRGESARLDDQKIKSRTIKGIVRDKSTGDPLPGATIKIKGTSVGTATNMDGKFELTVADNLIALEVSFIGYETVEVTVGKREQLEGLLETESSKMDEVVVTGVYTRKKESFTGSSQTYKAEELKSVGNQNLIQSLKVLDPAFAVLESNEFGSDPNRLPDLEIRGKSSIVGLKEQFGEDPNQPLFILDGFETTLRTIMDLSMDRIASVTILKDAASTAIYGAKAANGVVVVETKVPQGGRLRLSYNGSFEISFADLTDYNLMNAAEKLEFERLAGNFKSNIADNQELKEVRYNKLLGNVLRGVDTYWLSEPIRTGFNQRHNLYVEGGNEQFRYGFGGSYNKIQGVMKSSTRDIFSGNLDLLYRVGKLTFSNKLSVDVTKHDNPVVPFSEYAHANPYYPKRTADGAVEKWLEYKDNEYSATDASEIVGNPLWNAALNSYDRSEMFGVRNNFNLEYRPFDYLYVRGRFGVSKQTSDSEKFTSPDATEFDQVELLKKGSYNDMREDEFSYDGDLTLTYGQIFNDAHQINAVLGVSISERKSISKGFSAVGFPEGNFTTPGFSNEYPDNGKPSYGDSKNRSANFYFNGGYSYKNKYLLDANVRMDGTSVFGSNKKFTTTWAVGVAWNIHNEDFIKDNTDVFDMLKVRTSIGNPGNQNFGSYNTITTYQYNNWMQNNFGTGLLVSTFGDPDLQWQKTRDINVGFDLSIWSRFHINFDYFHKNTDPLLASIGIPSSVGMSSRLSNIGKQVNKGVNGTVRYAIIYRPQERINWTMSLSFRNVKTYYDKIGRKLNQYNKENISKNLTRYYDGGSPTALWAVRSAGIAPATGKEIFLTKDGKPTFQHNYDNEVVVGNTNPDVEGVWSNSLYWKGFSLNLHIRYSLGGQKFNNTLYEKVENISATGLSQNQDKRALYDRWQKPGDKAKFKGISQTDITPISSRFVQDNNYIAIESVRLAYEFPQRWMERIRFSGLTVSAYMNDICRFSTIKDERGISYPFARSVSMSISVNF